MATSPKKTEVKKPIAPIQAPPIEEVDDEVLEETRDEEEMAQKEEVKPIQNQQKQEQKQEKIEEKQEISNEEKVAIHIARLQNNGIYRAELLYRLDELSSKISQMNDSMVVMAEALIKVSGVGK